MLKIISFVIPTASNTANFIKVKINKNISQKMNVSALLMLFVLRKH